MPSVKKTSNDADRTHNKSSSTSSVKSGSNVSNKAMNGFTRNRHSTNDLRSPMLSNGHSNYDGNHNPERTTSGSLSDQLEVHTLSDIYSLDTASPLSPSHTAKKSQRTSLSQLTDSTTNDLSRKSSGNSSNSLSFDKLILSWDPTDPDEWTSPRITSWLKFHEFPDSWPITFKKYKIFGHNFIKLLAYENFAIHEKYLPQSKNASYTRFQHLLKQTMSKNVRNNNNVNNRSRNIEKLPSSRDSSGKFKNREGLDNKSRSASETVLSPTKSAPLKIDENNKNLKVRTHQKTKSASILYRKSFISLRGSSGSSASANNNNYYSTTPSSKNPINIKLNIPSRPSSIIETSTSPNKSNTTPLSPSYPNIFRRNHKSSSSESSLLNTLFFGTHGSTPNSSTTNTSGSPTLNHGKSHSSSKLKSMANSSEHKKRSSLDAKGKLSLVAHETSADSSMKSISTEEKSLWEKLKRRSQFSNPHILSNIPTPIEPSRNSSITTLTPGKVSDEASSPIGNSKNDLKLTKKQLQDRQSTSIAKQEEHKESKGKTFKLEEKYLPGSKKEDNKSIYILLTKDNKMYVPVHLDVIPSPESFKDAISNKLNLNPKQLSIHMTNFKGELGSPVTDDILDKLIKHSFEGSTMQFFVKDLSKIQNRIRAGTLPGDAHNTSRSVKSKGSVRSLASSIHGNTDDVSILTSSSDITSSEDHSPSNAFRRYPQTPSYYYDGSLLNNNGSEETNYWNVKEQVADVVPFPNLASKPTQKFILNLPDKKKSNNVYTETTSQGTFNVLRKDESGEIDFNKRRESPYVKSELAPKREAPKPPTNISPPRNMSLSTHATIKPRLRRTSTHHKGKNMTRPIPTILTKSPIDNISPTSDTIVSSYIPASTHVLVPQPYKGANDTLRKKKSDEEAVNPAINHINKQGVNRSNSVVSRSNSVFSSPSPLLKRGSSRRIISSASAADIFEENDITFGDAPTLSESDSEKYKGYDSDSSDDIIWTNPTGSSNDSKFGDKPETKGNASDLATPKTNKDGLARKMTLRPSPEVVYQNLEKFFPRANLDKPVLEDSLTPTSPISMRQGFQQTQMVIPLASNPFTERKEEVLQDEVKPLTSTNRLKTPKRTKTIRTIAHEASEKRKHSLKLTRQNTKMWGTKVVEITEKQSVAIDKSKNSKGEYKEFAWIKGEMIGKGSFGAVYLSLNITTGEMMAVKQVEVPKYSSQNENIMNMVEALESEVSTLKHLDHLNIVQYLGFEVKENIYSLFLEYVAGGSVGSLIRMYGRFDEPLIRSLTTQILEGLSYLHSRGILHRDMKADNVLLDQHGICKISDFGISKKSKDIYSNSDMTMRGTVFWMAPEMVDTKQGYSAKVDIWALGCVVLEMFAGKRPWSNLEVVAAMFKIGKAKSAPPIPEDTLPLISLDGLKFLDACFEIDPELRPTAEELLTHQFLKDNEIYDFKSTKLWKFIKSNDKINSTRLRVSSQDSGKDLM